MSVGGTIIDIVKVHSSKWWVNTMDRGDLNHVRAPARGRTCRCRKSATRASNIRIW